MSSRTHCGNQKINQSARETQKWPLHRANSSSLFLSAASFPTYLRTQLVMVKGKGERGRAGRCPSLCSVLLPLCLFALLSCGKGGNGGKGKL